MKRKQKMDSLTEQGYQARQQGKPCDAPVANSLERAAWENGWRACNADLNRLRIIMSHTTEEKLPSASRVGWIGPKR